MGDTRDGSTGTIDIDAASDRISSMLGDFSSADAGQGDDPVKTPETASAAPSASSSPTPEPAPLDVPKSWKKEMHDYWPKMPREAQQYYIEREEQMLNYVKPFQEVLKPYEHLFSQRKPHEMIGSLLRAQQMLTQGTDEQKFGHLKDLIKNLGYSDRFAEKQAQAIQDAQAQGQPQPNPEIQALSQKLSNLEQVMTQQQQAVYQQARSEAMQQIEAFAADKAHPYFDEVGDEIAIFIGQGKSLQDAYDMAVWANPVTRAKEQARAQTEHEAKLKENARLQSLSKKKAAGVNVQSRDTGRTPTEPLGSMEDTIKSTLREIRQRAS